MDSGTDTTVRLALARCHPCAWICLIFHTAQTNVAEVAKMYPPSPGAILSSDGVRRGASVTMPPRQPARFQVECEPEACFGDSGLMN